MRLEAENLAKLVAEGRAEGEAIGIAKRDMEIALAFLEKTKKADFSDAIEYLKKLNISEDIIESAIRQVKAKQDE
jgi:gamma-glutamylcysteine synthetase